MRAAAVLALLSAPTAFGHYIFWQTTYNDVTSEKWEYIRDTENDPVSGPILDPLSPSIACYEKAGRAAAKTLPVTAGSQISFVSSNSMGHPGPQLWYLARVPDGQTVDTWQPSGNVWFKIDQKGDHGKNYPEFDTNMWSFNTTIPSSLPNGNYLLRGEHIGLHAPPTPQFYLSCAQIAVTGGGSGKPSPLVSFPGAYTKEDPGLAVNIYAATGPYQYPGPAVWKG